MAVTVIVTNDRLVAILPELHSSRLSIGASDPVPRAVRRTEDPLVSMAVTIVVAGLRNISIQTPFDEGEGAVAAVQPVPDTVGWPEDRNVGPSVAVKVTRSWNIRRVSEMHGGKPGC